MFLELKSDKIINLNQVISIERTTNFSKHDNRVDFHMSDGSRNYIFCEDFSEVIRVYENIIRGLKTGKTFMSKEELM